MCVTNGFSPPAAHTGRSPPRASRSSPCSPRRPPPVGINRCPSRSGSAGTGGTGAVGGSGATGGAGGSPVANLTALSDQPGDGDVDGHARRTRRRRSSTPSPGSSTASRQDVTSKVSYSLTPERHRHDQPERPRHRRARRAASVTITASLRQPHRDRRLTVIYTFTGADPRMSVDRPGGRGDQVHQHDQRHDAGRPSSSTRTTACCSRPNVSGIEIHFTPGRQQHAVRGQRRGRARRASRSTSAAPRPPASPAASTCPIRRSGRASPDRTPARRRPSSPCAAPTTAARSVGASASTRMQFTKDAIMGGLYYWTTSGNSAIMRWDFGGSTTAAQPYLTPANTARQARGPASAVTRCRSTGPSWSRARAGRTTGVCCCGTWR